MLAFMGGCANNSSILDNKIEGSKLVVIGTILGSQNADVEKQDDIEQLENLFNEASYKKVTDQSNLKSSGGNWVLIYFYIPKEGVDSDELPDLSAIDANKWDIIRVTIDESDTITLPDGNRYTSKEINYSKMLGIYTDSID